AADAFAEMPARFPDSPWTPKGILAAIALGHPAADSLRQLLLTRYADNPYSRAAAGAADAPERFAALEDSLRVALAAAPWLTGTPGVIMETAPGPGPADEVPGRRPPPDAAPRPAPTP